MHTCTHARTHTVRSGWRRWRGSLRRSRRCTRARQWRTHARRWRRRNHRRASSSTGSGKRPRSRHPPVPPTVSLTVRITDRVGFVRLCVRACVGVYAGLGVDTSTSKYAAGCSASLRRATCCSALLLVARTRRPSRHSPPLPPSPSPSRPRPRPRPRPRLSASLDGCTACTVACSRAHADVHMHARTHARTHALPRMFCPTVAQYS
jgi:hypothetical protein